MDKLANILKGYGTYSASIIKLAAMALMFTGKLNPDMHDQFTNAVGALIAQLISVVGAFQAVTAIFQRRATAAVEAKVDQVVKVQTLNTPVAAAIAQADTNIVAAGGVGTISPPDVPAK